MAGTVETQVGHPFAVFTQRLHARLDELVDVPAWSATTAEQASVLVELSRARARLDEVWLRLLAAADHADVAAGSAAASTGAWLAAATRRHPGAATADVKLAGALDERFEATRSALGAGDVDLEQARVVVAAVQALPADAITEDPACRAKAEAALLGLARSHDARTLKRLGRHIEHVIEPEAADRRLGAHLEREERAAARATFLEVRDNGDGTHTGRFRISDFHAAALARMLDAIANPNRPGGSGAGPGQGGGASSKRSRPERQGFAFCELLERVPADRLPVSGGVSATVVVLLDYDTLLSGLGTARLDTGERISAAQARRLACQAGVIPAVVRRLVDGSSVVLDLGRKRRLHTEHQRIALAIEQGGCTAEHCSRPAGWCQAHHDLAWSAGGGTSVANGRLLCGFHHHKAHSSGYRTERVTGNQVRFHRRT